MPFVQRVIHPIFLSRPSQRERITPTNDPSNVSTAPKTLLSNKQISSNDEFDFIANFTLSNVLRQLASVLLVADEILTDLNDELKNIRHRTENVKQRIDGVERILEGFDSNIIRKL